MAMGFPWGAILWRSSRVLWVTAPSSASTQALRPEGNRPGLPLVEDGNRAEPLEPLEPLTQHTNHGLLSFGD